MISRRPDAGETPFEAFDDAFERLFRRAYRASYQIVRNREDAEDVAMDTMARALRDWTKLESPADGWVARVATNRSIDLWRRAQRRRKRDEPGGVGTPSRQPDDELALRQALVSLPKRQREVLGLRYFLDLSEKEIAAALGCSAGSVKQHASRGLAALRRQLGDESLSERLDADVADVAGAGSGATGGTAAGPVLEGETCVR